MGHAAGSSCDPDGRLSQILYGIMFARAICRLALVEALYWGNQQSAGSAASVDAFYQTPKIGSTPVASIALVRAAGVLTMIVLGAFPCAAWRRSPRSGDDKHTQLLLGYHLRHPRWQGV